MKQGFNIYEAEKDDKEYKKVRRDNFITSHPEDRDRMNEPYNQERWRYMMPHTAVELLLECFGGDERQAYLIKRAIEISIEHFAIEMEDDVECMRIVEQRVENSESKF